MHNDSLLTIEVPNINYYLKKGLLEVFSFQHIHYFSSQTFVKIAKKCDFSFTKFVETPENLIVYFKRNYKKNKIIKNTFKKNSETFHANIKKNYVKLNKIISQYKPSEICLWGAGGFANAVINLYKIPISSKTLIVDKDKSKINLSIGDSELKIKKVTKNNLKSKKLIIISSYYTNEIYKEIKELKLNINVLKIFPSIVIKKNV